VAQAEQGLKTPGRRGWLSGLISILLSLLGLVFLLSRLDLAQVGQALRGMDYAFFLLSLLLATGVQVFFPWRWCVLLNYRISLWHSVTACFAGDFINAITPLRLGEIARAVLIRRSQAVPLSEALSSIVLAQVLDLLSLLLMGVLLLWAAPLPPQLVQSGGLLGLLTLAGLALLFVMTRWGTQIEARLSPGLLRLVGAGLGDRLLRLFRSTLTGLQALRNPLQLLYASLISVALWLVIAWSGWVLLLGMMDAPGLELGLAVSFAGGIGRLLPALPGSIGTLDFAVLISLTTLGVPDDTAIAFVLLLRLRYVLLTAITGVIGLLGEGLSLGGLRRLVSAPRP
jgi:uncharacterized protein (TIRG00374 family)